MKLLGREENFEFVNKEELRTEDLVVHAIAKLLEDKFKTTTIGFEHEGDVYIICDSSTFDVVMTVCNTDTKTVVKLEEIVVNEQYRGQGIGTLLIREIQIMCNLKNVTLGLWVRKEKERLLEYYKKLGFKHVATKKDYWLEWDGE